MKIIIDADACPVGAKELLFRVSKRCKIQIILVANQYMRFPESELISLEKVPAGADEADDHIVIIANCGDIVITSDIPLASRVIKKSVVVLDPRGVLLTEGNIGPRLAMRNLMDNLRSEGLNTGGPGVYGPKEKQAFANQLDKLINTMVDSGS